MIMDDKFQNKYRIFSTRLQNWDYGWNASYLYHHLHQKQGTLFWQSLYNDHIIRDNQSFDRIQNYINTNINNWKNDDFYK